MNIFVLDNDPEKAVRDLCDTHSHKMLLETAQLLCSPFEAGYAPYRRTHYNHPCSKWVRETVNNYRWLLRYGFCISDEYTFRYKRVHKSSEVIRWCYDNYESLSLPAGGMTRHALCMPDKYKGDDVVESYRRFYRGDKVSFATWDKGREAPGWWGNPVDT